MINMINAMESKVGYTDAGEVKRRREHWAGALCVS